MPTQANQKPTYTDIFNALLPPLRQCIDARIADLERLHAELAQVTKNSCTGVAHWRDSEDPKIARKLYANHGKDVACPVHGQPAQGKRLRVYIGSSPPKIDAALRAIALNKNRLQVSREAARTRNQLSQAAHSLRRVYYALDFTYPEPDEPKAYNRTRPTSKE